jgi:hypothetical protein
LPSFVSLWLRHCLDLPTMSDPNMVARPKALGPGMVATPKHRSDIIARLRRGCDIFLGQAWHESNRKNKKKFKILIFHMKKLKHNPCGYKLKDYFKRFFLSHIEKMLFYRIKLKYLNKKRFLSYIEKTQFFSCEHKVCVCVCVLMGLIMKK